MNVFELLFTQPIFNLLLFLYGVIPGQDLGVAVILFTVLVRLALWPLVKKQLHQGKVMRDLQPQLAAVRKKAAGNKQLEGQLMLELYKEKGVNPLGSIGLLLVQLPFFIALYSAINIIASQRQDIPRFTYEFLQGIPAVNEVVSNPQAFNETLFGFIDLTKSVFNSDLAPAGALVLIAVVTGVVQFYQSKQLMPRPKDGKRLRDMLKDQAAGKEVDQTEVMAAATRRTVYIIPAVMFGVCVTVVGALELYLFASTVTGYIQQQFVLGKDTEEMEEIAAAPDARKTSAPKTGGKKSRSRRAKTAKIITQPDKGVSSPTKRRKR